VGAVASDLSKLLKRFPIEHLAQNQRVEFRLSTHKGSG
jgi:hypothetical protein